MDGRSSQAGRPGSKRERAPAPPLAGPARSLSVAVGGWGTDGLVAERVALVGVALEEPDAGDLVLERPAVAEHVEPVAQVDDVDEPVLDDRVAPHHDLLVAARVGVRGESRVL